MRCTLGPWKWEFSHELPDPAPWLILDWYILVPPPYPVFLNVRFFKSHFYPSSMAWWTSWCSTIFSQLKFDSQTHHYCNALDKTVCLFPITLNLGIAHGPVVAGVIGATKPQYDIWGMTVNLASRMDSTGVSGRIQVPEGTSKILVDRGFKREFRGDIYVKGVSERQGGVRTYFISSREQRFDFIFSTDIYTISSPSSQSKTLIQ